MTQTIKQREALAKAMRSPIMRDRITPAQRVIPETARDAARIDVRGADRRHDLGPLCIRCGHLRPVWGRLWQWIRDAWTKPAGC